ncbi:DUF4186 domain-containing protein [Planctomycetales bacterium ZRK34]|nr:DUF4186 domain-containing protein [Planctomycetales bacterium ZRK34]
MERILRRLQGSAFRRKFSLGPVEQQLMRRHGAEVIDEHARRFVLERLAGANPPNDGRQTPWRGHPVFVAQHATATCCRKCLSEWHRIAAGRALDEQQVAYIVTVIGAWLDRQAMAGGDKPDPPGLFED